MGMKLLLRVLCCLAPFIASGQTVINEVLAANADINYDPQFFNFSNWVELHNTSNAPHDISGYFLSDSPSAPLKWEIPAGTIVAAHGYLIIWCDGTNTGLHANFKIEPTADEILLSQPDGTLADQIVYSQQYFNISWARITDGATSWNFSAIPTPAAANVVGLQTQLLHKVKFGLPSGRYSSGINLMLEHTEVPDAEIRYTTDGSEPTQASPQFLGAILLSQTTVVKTKAFHANYLPSETVSATYFINEHTFTLPVVSLSANPTYLFDDLIGVYVQGTNGIQKHCTTFPANWNQDWDRHGVFELHNTSGESIYNQHLTFRLAGNCSRREAQKSLALKARTEFGSGKINYPLFDSKSIKKYDEFFLRNAGNDSNIAHMRDALLQSLPIGMMDVDYMAYTPSALYINGQYWGIQDMREKIDGDFIENNYGIPKEDIDLLENNSTVIEGDTYAWFNYVDSLELLDPNNPDTYKFLEKHIDVQEYINYIVTQVYVANSDWPNNVKFWRQRSTNGKFRWILWDLDFGFGLIPSHANFNHPTLDYATELNSTGDNSPSFTRPIRLAMAVPQFKDKFIASLSAAMGATFSPTRVVSKINEFQQNLASEMPFHKQRWGGTVADWNGEVQELRDFAVARFNYLTGHIATHFGLTPYSLEAKTFPANTGAIRINNVTTNAVALTPYFDGITLKLEGLPKSGFRVKQWAITERNVTTTLIAQTGSTWKFLAQPTGPAANWPLHDYDDTAWTSGPSQLGYGDGDEATVVPFGPSSGNKYITTYFRKAFNVADTSLVLSLTSSVLFDDGIVVYLNGHEVFRFNMPNGTPTHSTLASNDKSDENQFHSFTIPKNYLRNGLNILSAEVHQLTVSSSDISFDLLASMTEFSSPITEIKNQHTVIDTVETHIAALVTFEPVPQITTLAINEISATNTNTLDEFGQSEDWIELKNIGSTPIDLQGLLITDNPSKKGKFQLSSPNGTWPLAAGNYQLLWADDDEKQGPQHLSYNLSADGEGVFIYQLVGFDTILIASHTFEKQIRGFSLARIPDGTGNFEFTFSKTPATQNLQAPLALGLVLNEISATPTSFKDENNESVDWIELLNTTHQSIALEGLFISDDPSNPLKHMLSNQFNGWSLDPSSYQVLIANNQENGPKDRIGFRLSAEGETVALYQVTGGDTVKLSEVTFGKQVSGFSYARIPNGAGAFESTFLTTPAKENQRVPVKTGLVINEIAATQGTYRDENGEQEDWIELFNATSNQIDLEGLFISDDAQNPFKHQLKNDFMGIPVLANGYKILIADEDSQAGNSHVGFKLSSGGEHIGLYQLTANDTIELASLEYDAQLPYFGVARLPNGSGDFKRTYTLTPGSENNETPPVEGLVLNEVSSQESTFLDDEGEAEDWIELFNAGTNPINLSGIFLTDNPTEKLKHMLPITDVPWIIPPGGYQILWADDEAEGIAHLPFKLSSEGEVVSAYQILGADTAVLFIAPYNFQSPGYSFARIPNGSGPFELTPFMTPGEENEAIGEALRLYPNPVNDSFKVLLQEENATVSIFDFTGKPILKTGYLAPHEATVDVAGLAVGVYHVMVQYPSKSFSTTLVINR